MSGNSRRLRGIILTLTERCNLRCDYCYVPVECGRTMTREIADQAVDWYAANAAADGTLGLSFFGGEPFLAADQMQAATRRLRDLLPAERAVRVVTPTNALAMSEADLAWCRQQDIELAISIDGGAEACGRRRVDGSECGSALVAKVPEILRKLPPGTALARMTVTPANVGALCANLRALGRMGFERIVYLPDYDAGWDEAAIALWRREHQRLTTWMVGARAAGKQPPALPAWQAIAARLVRGQPRRRCGAGLDQVSITPEGGIHPCYRFAYAKDAEAWRLGDVRDGTLDAGKVTRLERADVSHLRPERGACSTCPAADGCTHHCPALGFLASGDVDRVPEIACRLLEAQVAAVRELCAASGRAARPRTPPLPWARTAALAAAVAGLGACKSNDALPPLDAGNANQTRDVGVGGGICAVQINRDASAPTDLAATDTESLDGDEPDTADAGYIPVGGICAPLVVP
jgi:radical SAM protein with 4Fe4S-binding SPASM domain